MRKLEYSSFGPFFVVGKEKIISVAREYNLVLSVDRDELILNDIYSLPGENYYKKNLVSRVLEWNEKVIFVPYNAKCVYIKEKDEFRIVDLSGILDIYLENKFADAFVYNNHIYMLGHWASKIVGINLISEEIDFVYDVPDEYIVMKEKKEDAFFLNCLVEYGKAIVPFLSGAYIVVLDLESGEGEWKEIKGESNGFSQVFRKDNGEIVLWHRHGGGIIVLDEKWNKIKTLFEKIDFHYSLCAYPFDKQVWVSCYDGESYLFDLNKEEYTIMDEKYVSVYQNGDCIVATRNEGIDFVNWRDGKREQKTIDFSKYDYLLEKQLKNKAIEGILHENSVINMANFIKIIV